MSNYYILLSPFFLTLLLAANVTTAATTPLYNAGYSKGIQDAKASPNIRTPVTIDEIDCEDMPDLKPGVDGGDWCNGYRNGFVDTIMNR